MGSQMINAHLDASEENHHVEKRLLLNNSQELLKSMTVNLSELYIFLGLRIVNVEDGTRK